MTNPFYETTYDVLPGNRVGSQRLEDQLLLIEQGFDAVNDALDIGAANGTSTTSLTIDLLDKSLTTQTGRAFYAGQSLVIASTASPTNRMMGVCLSYDTATGALVMDSTSFEGSGTFAAWTISLSPSSGATLGANTFSGVQNMAVGASIASAATINLDTATGNFLHITGTTTITAVTLAKGPRWVIFDGILTLTHHATNNNLPGGADLKTAAGDRALYWSDGTTVYCIHFIKAATNHAVVLRSGNGHGSTNNKIRRYTTTEVNVGTAIVYTDSAADGASLTITEPGMYAMEMGDSRAAAASIHGISLNSSQLTTSMGSLTPSTVLVSTQSPSGSWVAASCVRPFVAGDVVRPHTEGNQDSTSALTSFFSIRKIGP